MGEKFFSHEVRKVEARKSKASLERKTRMKKWNRAKKAVLLGVRGATGLGGLSFGGLKIGGGKSGSMNAGGKAAEGSAALSIIGALGKGKDSKDMKEKNENEKKNDGKNKDEEEKIKLESPFAFPDDERDMQSGTAAFGGSETDATSGDDSDSDTEGMQSTAGEETDGDTNASSNININKSGVVDAAKSKKVTKWMLLFIIHLVMIHRMAVVQEVVQEAVQEVILQTKTKQKRVIQVVI